MNKIIKYISSITVMTLLLIILSCSRGQGDDSDSKKNIQNNQEKTSDVTSSREASFTGKNIPSEEAIHQMIGQLESMFQELEEARSDLQTDRFNSQVILDQVGSDPTQLYEWVRDKTFLVPYRGSLRGPRGVLMDRMGNSLDRALLLYELLDSAGHEVRLARASLTEQKAEEVYQEIQSSRAEFSDRTQEFSPQAEDDFLEKFAVKYNLNSENLHSAIKNMRFKEEHRSKEVNNRVNKQVAAIMEALGKSKAEKDSAEGNAELSAIQDHWWVQWESEETWIDIDPTLSDMKLGQALAEAEDWCDPDDLDEEILHLVHIRVVIELWTGGSIQEKTVLEHTLRPSEVFDERIDLHHSPINWPIDTDLFTQEKPLEQLKTAILDEKAWVPTLSVGSEEIVGTIFTDTGDLIERKKKASGIQSFQRSFLRGISKGKTKKELKKDAFLTAEWIEYHILMPGQPDRIIRREIFDLLGPARREKSEDTVLEITTAQRIGRSMNILSHAEILVINSQISTDFIEYLTIKNMLANRELFLELIQNVNDSRPQEVLTRMAQLTPLPGSMYDLALVRGKLGPLHRQAYLDQPNILSHHIGLRPNPQGELVRYQRLDIISNDIAILGGIRENSFLSRLKQGVMDTNIEAFLLGQDEKTENTSELYAQGHDWLTIHDPEGKAFKSLELNQDIQFRIKQELKAGYIILAPKRAVKMNGHKYVAWWRINPRTGHTLGIGEYGWGQAIVEYVEIAQTMIQLKLQIESYMGIMECIVNTAALAIAGADLKTVSAYAVKECIWDIICNYLLGLITERFLADRVWSNFIIDKTADWMSDNICGAAMD